MMAPAVVDVCLVGPVQPYVLRIGKLGWIAASGDEGNQDALSLLNVSGPWAISELHFRGRGFAENPERRRGEPEAVVGLDENHDT